MIGFKKYSWIFALIGGIITYISFLTPAAVFIYRSPSFDSDFYLWMINLYFSHRYESGIHTISIEFDTPLISLIPSIICSLLIIIISTITLITANKYRKGVLDSSISWLVSAIVTIIATVIWMIMIEISRRVLYGHEFWGLGPTIPGFGIIGLFLGAGLEIVGYIFSKKRLRYG